MIGMKIPCLKTQKWATRRNSFMIIQKECKCCGKTFIAKGHRPTLQLYCSSACKRKKDSMQKRYIYYCTNCGQQLNRSRKITGQKPFCNQNCLNEYQHKQKYEKRICEICKTEFECSKKSKQRFCSNRCQIQWQKENPVSGINHPSYKQEITIEQRTLTCQWCQQKYVVKPYEIAISKFCSHACKLQGMLEQARTQKSWEQRVDTAPQRITNEILKTLSIKFSNEYPCGYFRIDNYCQDYNLPIEVMGTYWHADIRLYKQISSLQYRDIIQDKKKHTYVMNHLHAEILYLWEYDLYNNKELCQKLIELYITNKGQLKNYHSYNYHIEGSIIKLNDQIINGYIESKNDYHSLIINETSND